MIKIKDERIVGLMKELVRRIAGKNTEVIVDVLFSKENLNEFKIAEKLKLTINQTRNILYRMSNHGILESTRKKDKRKGWYTYFWTLNLIKSLETLKKMKQAELHVLHQMLKSREMKNFYRCNLDNIEMNEETAMHHHFLCPECGQLLQPVAEEKKLKEITTKIEETQKQLAIVEEELQRITPKPKIILPKQKKQKKVKKKQKKIKIKKKGKVKKKAKIKKVKKIKKKKAKHKKKKKAKKAKIKKKVKKPKAKKKKRIKKKGKKKGKKKR